MAQVDYFLKVDGIEGESKDSKHPNEIELLSWSFGETQSGTMAYGGGGGAGKVTFQDISFTKKVDKASPKLFLACATGQHIKKAVLTARKAGGKAEEYMIVTLTDTLVSSYQLSGHNGDVVPTDSFSFNYGKIEYQYKPQDEKGGLGGAVKTGYDLKANKKV